MLTYVLLTAEDKMVQIEMLKNKPTLCAVDAYEMEADKNVGIQPRNTNQNQKAFLFSHKMEHYCLKVDGNNLRLERREKPDHYEDGYWFERVNLAGTCEYGLKTVGENPQYIIITQSKLPVFGLAQTSDEICPFRHT